MTDKTITTKKPVDPKDIPGGTATSAELFAALGSINPEKDEREINAVIRRMDIKENNK